MKLHQENPTHRPLIRERHASYWQVGSERCAAPFMITGDQIKPWGITDLNACQNADSLLMYCDTAPELIIIGANQPLTLPSQCSAELQQQKIGIESMHLDAAARTFNLLVHDDRRVAGFFLFDPTAE